MNDSITLTPGTHEQVAGWAGGAGACGVECSCGTTYDGFDTLADALDHLGRHIAGEHPEYSPSTAVEPGAEVVDAEVIPDKPTRAREMAAGLRRLAAMIEANPALAADGDGGWGDDGEYWATEHGPLRYTFDRILTPTHTKAPTAALARAGARIGATVTKHQDGQWAGVTLAFGGGVNLWVYADREEICERKVVGQKTVTKTVPDPEALAAVPKVTVTEVVDEVEWICSPLLAEALPAGAR